MDAQPHEVLQLAVARLRFHMRNQEYDAGEYVKTEAAAERLESLIEAKGKCVVLRIDGDDEYAFASRHATRELCKKLFRSSDQFCKSMGTKIGLQLQVIEDEIRSRMGRTGRPSNAEGNPPFDSP